MLFRSKAPGVTRERLYLDMMQSVIGNASKVLIDQKGGNSLLYLPLDKLIQQSANAAASAAGGAAAAPATPAPAPEPPVSLDGGAARSRETLRSRDRGDAR